jgi:ADP-heptose:LPS heptosyltransferase
MDSVPRILVLRFSSIGDVVRVLPAVQALKNALPDSEISWAVDSTCSTLLEDVPCIDRLLVFHGAKVFYRRPWATFRLLQTIWKTRFDVVVDFHANNLGGLCSLVSRAELRYGFPSAQCRGLAKFGSNRRVAFGRPAVNRLEQFFLLAGAVTPLQPVLHPTIPVSNTIREECESILGQAKSYGRPVVAVHVANNSPFKRWPVRSFAEVCDRLVDEEGCTVVLTWGPGQQDVADAVQESMGNRAIMAPTRTLKHYIGLLEYVDMYLGTDTGPMHMASALGVPVVCIFQGSNFFVHGPSRQPSRVLSSGRFAKEIGVSAVARDRLFPQSEVAPDTAFHACVSMLRNTFGTRE